MRRLALFAFAMLVSIPVHAEALININTADQKTLETLPHVGATTAQKIIAYREANGPYAAIEDIRKASSYISASYYADIAPLITVGDSAADTSDDTASTTSAASTDSGHAPPYAPPPASLTVSIDEPSAAVMNAPITFTASAKVKGGSIDRDARVVWSFGDGSAAEGSVVTKTYRYAGTYLVVAIASHGQVTARDEYEITVMPAAARVAAVTGDGVLIANGGDERLDLSGWRVSSTKGSFVIPQGTMILPRSSVLFPFTIMNMPIAFDIVLEYPAGVVAARYAPAQAAEPAPAPVVSSAPVQPAPLAASYKQVKAVETITSITDTSPHGDAVDAPAAATKLAAAGAAVGDAPAASASRSGGLFRSPWTYGFLGLMALAAGAFILL